MRFILKRMFHKKWSTLSFFLVFVLIFSALPFGIYQSWEVQVIVDETIDSNSRGSYDILVRPHNTRTEVELTHNTIEENYIGDGKGGISVEEWENISKNPLIEVAAPIASLGYMSGIGYTLQLAMPPINESARYKVEFFTTDGLSTYSLGEPSYSYALADSSDNSEEESDDHQNVKNTDETFVYGYLIEKLPDSYHLLVAIDPISEEQLTGISFNDLLEEVPSDEFQEFRERFPNAQVIKVLQREELTVPLSVKISVDTIRVNLEDLLTQLDLSEGDWLMDNSNHTNFGRVVNQLKKTPSLDSQVIEKDLTNWQHPFDATPIVFNENWEIQDAEAYMMSHKNPVYYVADSVNYMEENNLLKVKQLEYNEVPIYKNLEKVEDIENPTFLIGEVGTFSTSTINETQLTSSPLGIYSIPTVLNSEGKSVIPTALPGSFIASAASGITTLKAAESIKGDKPIDAIRIRLAGITTYNDDAQKKVEEVATDLLKQGYEVDIVIGSSLREQTLEVEGIGEVTTPWTTLGISPMLKTTWNQGTFIMVSLFGVFGLCWLSSRLMIERATLAEEKKVLEQIGWTKRELRNHELKGQLFSYIVTNVIALLVLWIVNVPSYVYKLNFILFCIIFIFVLVLTNGKSREFALRKFDSKFPALHYYRPYVVQLSLLVFMSYMTINLLLINITHNYKVFYSTTLGEYALGTVFLIQIILIIAGIFMAVTSSSESISIFLKERKEELQLYKSVGWTEKRIFWHFLKESSIWISLSLFVSMLFILAFSLWLQYNLAYVLFVILGTACILSVLLIIVIRLCVRRFLQSLGL